MFLSPPSLSSGERAKKISPDLSPVLENGKSGKVEPVRVRADLNKLSSSRTESAERSAA